MAEHVTLMEVGPRDGLQNQSKILDLAVKRRYIELLLDAGVKSFEAGSFVRDDYVPQMAKSGDLLKSLDLRGAEAFFLIPNEKGLDLALDKGVRHLAVFTACTDTFNKKNIGMSMKKSATVLEQIVPRALQEGLKVRGYVSVVWGCPYEGTPKFANIKNITQKLLDLGCYEVSLGDTIGMGTPGEVEQVLQKLKKSLPIHKLAGHFHDTRGMGVANVYSALKEGIRTIDSASGGLGGCPFAPGAAGNVGTEDVLYLIQGLGMKTGIDLQKLMQASLFIYQALGITNPKLYSSKTLQALSP